MNQPEDPVVRAFVGTLAVLAGAAMLSAPSSGFAPLLVVCSAGFAAAALFKVIFPDA